MKVIVASSRTQGQRKSDFMNANEGEPLAFIGFECDRGTVDDKCGCRRALSGVDSHKATTTGEVADLPLTLDEIREMLRQNLMRGGWMKEDGSDPYGLLNDTVADFMLLARFAERLEVGTPVERRGNALRSRIEGAAPRPRRRRTA